MHRPVPIYYIFMSRTSRAAFFFLFVENQKILESLLSTFVFTRLIQQPKFRTAYASFVQVVTPMFLSKKIVAKKSKLDFLKNL